MKLLSQSGYRVMPWKNGGGSTAELFRADGTDGQMDWRVSIATVTSDGPFSTFPGYDRHIVTLAGEGMVLEGGPDGPIAVTPARVPKQFSGDWPISARLIGGSIEDFNLIVRRSKYASSLSVLTIDAPILLDTAGESFVYAIRGAVEIDGEEMSAGQSLVGHAAAPLSISPRNGNSVVAVCTVNRRDDQ